MAGIARKRRKNKAIRSSLLAGVNSTYNIMGDGLELRDCDNLEASWYNVGIFFRRSINHVSLDRSKKNRYTPEELETI